MDSIQNGLFSEDARMAGSLNPVQVAQIGDLQLESGEVLPHVELAYQTWGNPAHPAILICHAVSGDSDAVSWWPHLVGAGKPVDSEEFFLICSNVIGGCKGSTGPLTPKEDGQIWGRDFPAVSIGDMVEAQARFVSSLGIERLHMVCGGSMGGMQALEWAIRFPDRVERCWLAASAPRHSAFQIAINAVAREAIYADTEFASSGRSERGLAVARMIGHISYLSEGAFDQKFGRELQPGMQIGNANRPMFSVESYLRHQGAKFVDRFDSVSFLRLTEALDTYSAGPMPSSATEFLFTSFSSDWLYPPHQSQAMHEACLSASNTSRHVQIDVPYGHDSFLLEHIHQGKAVRELLQSRYTSPSASA